MDVTVSFNATANDPREPTGNVTRVELTLDGGTVGAHDNPPGTKSGSHAFGVDLSGVAAGEHTLVARAYQGNPDAGHVGTSAPVTIVVVRDPHRRLRPTSRLPRSRLESTRPRTPPGGTPSPPSSRSTRATAARGSPP